MKNLFITLILFSILAALPGCSTSRYNYVIDPTPLIKGQTKYYLKNITVNLDENGSFFADDAAKSSYLSQDDMARVFREKIGIYLKKHNILDKDLSGYNVSISLEYTRIFVALSNTITRPTFYYSWVIEKDNEVVAKYSSEKMQLNPGIGKGFDVFTKIGSSGTNPQVEPIYLEIIAKYIVEKDLADIGK